MAIDPTTHESRLLYAYANALRTADGEDTVAPAAEGDMTGVEETANAYGEATSAGFTITPREGDSLSAVEDPATNAQYSEWHGVLAGQAAQRIEEIGFDVHKVMVGRGLDTFQANFGDIPVTVVMDGGYGDVFGDLTTLFGLINDNCYDENATPAHNASLMGGVAAVHFPSGNGYVSFEMSDGTELLLDKSQLNITAFQAANKTAVALSQVDLAGQGATLTGRVIVDESGRVAVEYNYTHPTDGEQSDHVNIGDITNLNPAEIRARLLDKIGSFTGQHVGAAAKLDYYNRAMLDTSLSLEERRGACNQLAEVWPSAVSGEIPQTEVFQAVLNALNQPGEDPASDGYAINLAGIQTLAFMDSPRSVAILEMIASRSEHSDFRSAAQASLQNIAQNASDEGVKTRAAAVLRRGSGASIT